MEDGFNWIAGISAPALLFSLALSLWCIPGDVPERNAKGRFCFNKAEMRPGPFRDLCYSFETPRTNELHHKRSPAAGVLSRAKGKNSLGQGEEGVEQDSEYACLAFSAQSTLSCAEDGGCHHYGMYGALSVPLPGVMRSERTKLLPHLVSP